MNGRGRRRDIKGDLRDGVSAGLYLAAAYSVIGALLVALGGARVLGSIAKSLLVVVPAYFLGGVLSGLAYVLGQPMGRTALGAMLLGFLVALPSTIVVGLLVIPPTDLRALPKFAVAFALVAGPAMGLIRWQDSKR